MLDISGESYLFEIVFYERIRAADSYRNRLLFGLLSVMLRAGDESERFFHDIVGITHNMNIVQALDVSTEGICHQSFRDY